MKKATKVTLALLLCFVMLFALVACNNTGNGNDTTGTQTDDGGSTQDNSTGDSSGDTSSGTSGDTSADTPVSAKDTLTVSVSGDNGTLVPADITGTFIGVVRQYMEVLVDFTAEGDPVWVLATDIEQGTDTWTVHLREGVTFSNGNKFNADDVWFTFEYYKSDPMSANFLTCFDMEKSKIIDEYTIELALSHYSMQQFGSLCQIYILDAETFSEDTFIMEPVGTGPYVITDYVINSHLYMKANENYWGEKAKIENLQFRVFNESAQMVNAIQTGLVDVSSIPSQDIEYVKTLPGYIVDMYYSILTPTISFNMTENSIMNNLDARLAVCYAADRQAIIDIVYDGHADVLHYPLSMNCLDYEDRFGNLHPTYSIGRDLDLARQHAEAAGLVGQDIVAITNGSLLYSTEAELLQADLAQIGVNLIINNYDAGSYFSISQDTTMFDISLYAVASPQGYAAGMLYEYVMWGANNYGKGWDGYEDYLALGAAIVANPDTASRSDMLLELSQQFVDVAPWYGICDVMSGMAINEDLGGVEFWNSGGMRYVDWYWKS